MYLELNKLSKKEKAKLKKLKHQVEYEKLGNLMLSTMFNYENSYEGFFPRQMELGLIQHGCVITTRNAAGELITIPAAPAELPNQNGEYIKFIGWSHEGHTYTRINHKDCVVCYNNNIASPDLLIEFFSTILNEIDASINCAIHNSRNVPLPVAHDPKTVESLKQTIEAIREGRTEVVLDKNTLTLLENGLSAIEVVNLTDPTSADKIQYLSKIHDDILRRAATLYGHNLNGSPKAAQQSIEEIQGSESFSWIIALDKLNQRILWCNECSEMFPEMKDIKVSFTPAWNIQLMNFMKESIDESINESMQEGINESLQESLEEIIDEDLPEEPAVKPEGNDEESEEENDEN